jgi:hypothetical protein
VIDNDEPPGIDPRVVRLVNESLPSMMHIELLLLLARTYPQSWSAAAAATELRTKPELVAATSADLERKRLVVHSAASGDLLFNAADEQLTATTQALTDVYERRPVALVKILYSRPSSPATAFADAFRVRPRHEDAP